MATEDQVRHFLASFKTVRCENMADHNHRDCFYYHEWETDGRRDPYKQLYGVHETSNRMEKIYHPAIFRTTMWG